MENGGAHSGFSGFAPDTSEQQAAVYVHIPFCRTKCPYCSFVSYPEQDSNVKNRYMEALAKQAQIMTRHPWSVPHRFSSLFVGGGTPTSVAPEKLAAFIETCLSGFDFLAENGREPEVTVEVNPNTVTPKYLKLLRSAGVNRLSLGTQAFSDTILNNLGRKHTVKDNNQTFEWARSAGFSNISLDLMYGLPGQDTETWMKTLELAAALSPEHLSVYELTIEPDTPFFRLAKTGRLNLPTEETTLAMFRQARDFLAAKDFIHYEISNYSRRQFACRHNMNYWENGSYLGLGAGAVSCYSGLRTKNHDDPGRFVQQVENNIEPYAEAECLPLEARFRETVIMGLRLTAGVSIKRLKERFGLTPHQYYGDLLEKLKEERLLTEANSRLRLTRKGLPVANRVMAQLV